MKEDAKYPICPLNMFFEGDENKCNTKNCDFESGLRMCTSQCTSKLIRKKKRELDKAYLILGYFCGILQTIVIWIAYNILKGRLL